MSDQTSPTAEQMPSAVGRYQITGTLGFGAMGAVYKAFDPLIKRTLAIKTIRLDVSRQSAQYASFIERFYREARISGTLSHPNIVTLFDIGEEAGVPFLAMEFVDGRTIAAVIEEGTRFKPEKVIALVSQVAAAIDYAHSRGVVHRDIKPSNLIVYEDDKVKVTDFGIAKLADAEITHAGVLLGTPSYMSPEQAMGEKLDGRSDIFSLGVCAFEMLSGQQPFPGTNVTAILYKLVHVDPIEPADLELNGLVPQKWREVFHKVLAKKPANRYQTAGAFVQDLEYCLGSWFTGLGEPTLQLPGVTPETAPTAALRAPVSDLEPTVQLAPEPEVDGSHTIPFHAAEVAGRREAPAPPQPGTEETAAVRELPTQILPPSKPRGGDSAGAAARPAGRKRSGWISAATVVAVLAAAGVAGWVLWQRGRVPSATPVPEATPVELGDGAAAATPVPPEPASGSIRIETRPAGARVLLDGAPRGEAPLELGELLLGSYDVRAELSGFEPQARTVLLSAEQPAALVRLELVRSPVAAGAADVLSSPPGATVTVDGRAAGRTPLDAFAMKPGSHRLELTLAGHETWTGTIDVVAGQKGRVEVRLRALPQAVATPTPAAVDPSRVYGPHEVDTQPRKRAGDSPSYPTDRGARRLKSGERVSVMVEFVVSADGDVEDLKVVESGGAVLDEVVSAAIRGWKFQPATKRGTPVRSRTAFKQTFLGG